MHVHWHRQFNYTPSLLYFKTLLSGCVRTACSQRFVDKVFDSTDLLHVIPITGDRPAIQQYVNKL